MGMSANSNRQRRPAAAGTAAARRRRRTRGPRRASRAGVQGGSRNPQHPVAAGGAQPVARSWRQRFQTFVPSVVVPHAVVVLGIVVVVMAFLMLTSRPLGLMPAAIAQLWLVLNMVPVRMGGIELGTLPLLPALGLAWLLARRVRAVVRRRVSMRDLVALAVCVVGVPVALSVTAAAMLMDAREVYRVDAPSLWAALGNTALVHVGALLWGLKGRVWHAVARHLRVARSLVDAAELAVRYVGILLCCGAAVWFVLALLGWRRQLEVFELYGSAGGIAAALGVTVLYLPNAAVWGASVLVGGDLHCGAASASVFSVHTVPMPPLPLFAALPGEVPNWAVVVLAVPAALTIVMLYKAPPSWRQAVVFSATAATVMAVAAYLSGGALGVYGECGPIAWLTALLVALWTGSIGLMSAGVSQWDRWRREAHVPAEGAQPAAEDAHAPAAVAEPEDTQEEPEPEEDPEEDPEEPAEAEGSAVAAQPEAAEESADQDLKEDAEASSDTAAQSAAAADAEDADAGAADDDAEHTP